MARIIPMLAALLLLAITALAVPPIDNPIATANSGAAGYPAWTDTFKWSQVIDMSAYAKGNNAFEKFEAARDELAARGGGVLCYPAGEYDFSQGPFDGPTGRGLMLKSGVVIRGEVPAQRLQPASGTLSLGTIFRFGFTDRSAVAFDAGTRGRFLLRNGVKTAAGAKSTASDIVISLPVKDGKLGTEATGYITELPGTQLTGVVTQRNELDADGKNCTIIDVTLNTPAREGKPALDATYTLILYEKNGAYSGTYKGAANGVNVEGIVNGKIADVKPETPRDWNLVGLSLTPGQRISDVQNVGICYVHLIGATVFFGPDLAWGATWKTAGSWKSDYAKDGWGNRIPDGSHPGDPFTGGKNTYSGGGAGRLVFGCLLEDAAAVNNGMTCGVKNFGATPEHAAGFGAAGFYMQKFTGRITAYGTKVFIAENVIPKSTGRNFRYLQTTTRTRPNGGGGFAYGSLRQSPILFDYNKTCGIDVNKELIALTKTSATGAGAPGYFEEGITVRDNYVYNNGHKGYNLSGAWVTVANNIDDREVLCEGIDPYGIYGWRLTLDGFTEACLGGSGTISDNLSRAFDMGGRNVWLDRNHYWNTGSVPGNDGEGILCQAHGGTMVYSWASTRNVGEHPAPIHGSAMGSNFTWDVDIFGYFWGWNTTADEVGAHMNKRTPRQTVDISFTGNTAKVLTAPEGSYVEKEPVAIMKAPTDVIAEPYQDIAVKIAWKAAATNEVAFRVDRRIGTQPWGVIAYRPTQNQTHVDNPPVWVDFTAPTGVKLSYRVVAVTGKDDDSGASDATPAIMLARP